MIACAAGGYGGGGGGGGGYGQNGNYKGHGPIARNEAPPRIVPISSLNSYQSHWTIKARITNKSEIRRYSNARGEGTSSLSAADPQHLILGSLEVVWALPRTRGCIAIVKTSNRAC